jgi:DNA-binding NarL/FixJ family response regulator
MNALRLLQDWWAQRSWRRRVTADEAVSRSLAHDLGVPPDVINRVLEQTAADLRHLAAIDEASDARPIINKAVDELAKYGHPWWPFEEALMERCLEELPERDLTMLSHLKQGKQHREIAELMGTDLASVRRSLVNTYADLRLKTAGFTDRPESTQLGRSEVTSAETI